MSTSAEQRLKDYLIFRSIPIPADLGSADLNALGFDDIDWGILIGELQCDLGRLVQWSNPTQLRCLNDVLAHIDYSTRYQQSWKIYAAMDDAWPKAQLREIAYQAQEIVWPS